MRRMLVSMSVVVLFAAATVAEVAIQSVTSGVGPGNGGDKTLVAGLDASGADKLVVVIGGEHGFAGTTGGDFNSMTYGGTLMTRAIHEGSTIPTIAIFYLDDPGAAGDLVVNQANHNSSPYSIYMLTGTAAGIGAVNADIDASVDLTTTAANSLVIAGVFNSGPDGGNYPQALTADAPLVPDVINIGYARWVQFSSAHVMVAAPSGATYSYSGGAATDKIATAAGEFLDANPPPAGTVLMVR